MRDEDLDFHQPITLRDGRPAVIRVMRADDKPRLQSAFAKLDPQSVYTRFFSFRKSIPERAFERIAEIDFVNLAGLVVTLGSGADETVIGGASYVGRSDADGAKVAEVAFTIEEDFQGQGLASRLLAASSRWPGAMASCASRPRCCPSMRRCWPCSSAAACHCASAARAA